jgi:hypothetical protein
MQSKTLGITPPTCSVVRTDELTLYGCGSSGTTKNKLRCYTRPQEDVPGVLAVCDASGPEDIHGNACGGVPQYIIATQ